MAEQLSLLGDAPTKPTDRLFLGLFPNAAEAERIAELGRRLRADLALRGKLLETSRLHITLCHLGDYAGVPKNIVDKAMEAGRHVSAAPFDICFAHAVSFQGRPEKRPFVLTGGEGETSVEAFQRKLHLEMAKAGLGKWAKPYKPHMTLLYDDRLVAERPVEPIRWMARELVLIHSLLGKTEHIALGRWPLR